MFAGAKFTVILFVGNLNPQFLSAERTRSRDSLTAVSGKPTTSKAGIPFDISTSTDTKYPSIPISPALLILDSIVPLP